jgi:hypothetical protein
VRIRDEIVHRIPSRANGTGYPLGLPGQEILLGSRIFAVADIFDAMTSDRPYRRALPESVARDEILRESGGQFDPGVVPAFLSIPLEHSAEICEEVEPMLASNPFAYFEHSSSRNPLPVELAEMEGKWQDTGEDSLSSGLYRATTAVNATSYGQITSSAASPHLISVRAEVSVQTSTS